MKYLVEIDSSVIICTKIHKHLSSYSKDDADDMQSHRYTDTQSAWLSHKLMILRNIERRLQVKGCLRDQFAVYVSVYPSATSESQKSEARKGGH
jgi:hypothetical protein